MARTEIDFRNFLERMNCEVPSPKIVNLDLRDESPPNSSYDLNDFMCISHRTRSENTPGDNFTIETTNEITQLTSDKQKLAEHCVRNTDVTFGDLLNGIDAAITHSEQNICDFSNSVFTSFPHSNSYSMKLKNDSECGVNNLSDILSDVSIQDFDTSGHESHPYLSDDKFYSVKLKDDSENGVSNNLSDILSEISIQDYDSSTQKSYSKSISPASNISLNDIIIPDFCELDKSNLKLSTVHDSSIKNTTLSTEASFNEKSNFSDILSSICFDNCDQTVLNKSAESTSLLLVDKCICHRDLSIIGETCKEPSSDFKATFSVYGEEDNNINSGDLNTPSLAALAKSHFLTNNSIEISNGKAEEGENYLNTIPEKNYENWSTLVLPDDNISTSNQIAFNSCENSKEILSNSFTDANMLILDKSLDNLNTDFGFTFFPESLQDHSSTSRTLLNDSTNGSKNTIPADQNDKEENVSMLDLFNSLNSFKNSDSISSSFLSNETKKNGSSILHNYVSDDDDEVISNIDLSMCIKSNKDSSNAPSLDLMKKGSTVAMLKETQSCSPIHVSEDTLKYSLPLKNFSIPQTSQVKLKQSLFAKALSCKPKKDPTIIRKIADIKSELFNRVFYRPVPVENHVSDSKAKTVTHSNECILSFSGRRVFVPSAPCQFL